ncbi:MAG: acyl--CoA ligase, partial [Verrucomicrobiae bacterium]|nr:acyl--CoA ligase [Verrucomicrobiae bacterium]
VALSLSADWARTWHVLQEQTVDGLSCTPTFVDLLLQNEPAGGSSWHPRQLTLGGEPLRPGTADRIRRRWPGTRGTAVYASAEFGVVMKTARLDGWYEVADLEKRWPRWRIVDGTLELGVRTDDWAGTGDQVDRAGDLLRIIGRSDQVANVAGTKVSLAEVAALAEEVPGVRRARATAKASPVTGQVVVLHFEPEPGAGSRQVRAKLEQSLRMRLPKPAWPRDWIEERIGLAGNAKRAVA